MEIHGFCDSKFSPVEEAFQSNFEKNAAALASAAPPLQIPRRFAGSLCKSPYPLQGIRLDFAGVLLESRWHWPCLKGGALR